jgi:hypothetical protein
VVNEGHKDRMSELNRSLLPQNCGFFLPPRKHFDEFSVLTRDCLPSGSPPGLQPGVRPLLGTYNAQTTLCGNLCLSHFSCHLPPSLQDRGLLEV